MDINSLIEIDRQILTYVNGSDSLFLDKLMLTLTQGFTWIPLYISLFFLVMKNNETMAQILLVVGGAALCFILSDGMADGIVKPLVGRWRPSNDPIIKYSIDIVGQHRGTNYGFFSAHAANTFSLAIFFSLIVKDKLFTLFMVLWSFINCYTRMYLGLHYPGDIIVGLIWGTVVGICVYLLYHYIYRRISSTGEFISTHLTPSGYAMESVDVVILIMIITFIYAVFMAIL